ncbi:MAG TPA: peptide deformylase [Candidatus Sumerlaeota bacterium]|nr:peptide deformylase [Candidatus Sumerlaeota bacterium]
MSLKICIYGHPVLKQKAGEITGVTPEIRRLADDMAEAMAASGDGIGLAAPQVGQSIRMFIVDVDYIKNPSGNKRSGHKPGVFINPEVVWESDKDEAMGEGCLSLPGIRARVWRPLAIRMKYRDLDFKEHEIEAEGLMARCFLHEKDHLDGVLFVDRLNMARRALLAGKLYLLRSRASHEIEPVLLKDYPSEDIPDDDEDVTI